MWVALGTRAPAPSASPFETQGIAPNKGSGGVGAPHPAGKSAGLRLERGGRGGQQFFRMSCPFESSSRGFVRVSGRKNGGGGQRGRQRGGGCPGRWWDWGGKGEREMRRKQGAEKGGSHLPPAPGPRRTVWGLPPTLPGLRRFASPPSQSLWGCGVTPAPQPSVHTAAHSVCTQTHTRMHNPTHQRGAPGRQWGAGAQRNPTSPSPQPSPETPGCPGDHQ